MKAILSSAGHNWNRCLWLTVVKLQLCASQGIIYVSNKLKPTRMLRDNPLLDNIELRTLTSNVDASLVTSANSNANNSASIFTTIHDTTQFATALSSGIVNECQ